MKMIAVSIGLVLVVFSLAVLVRDDLRFWLRRCVRVDGTVADHRRCVDEGHENFQALIRFRADDGREHVVADGTLYSRPTPLLGSVVPLTYPVGDPLRARRPRPVQRSLIYGCLMLLAAVLGGHGAGWI